MRHDALLLLSFGGPDGPEDVLPFLENVVRGRGVPRERLLAVAEHYQHFGGVSPINAANRRLLADVTSQLRTEGLELAVYWGNRNWHPYVEDTVATMAADGVLSALVFATSGYSSYSGCRQYWEDLDRARKSVGDQAPELLKLRHFFDHPGFIEPQVDALAAAVNGIPNDRWGTTRIAFTAHSIPLAMAARSGPDAVAAPVQPRDGLYVRELTEAARLIAGAGAPGIEWDLVWQSRSGPPQVPWLEPDINDHIRVLAAEGVTDVIAVPVGFVSDHVEVLWDLDNEAAATAAEVGISFQRNTCAGTDSRFVAMIVDLVRERLDPARSRRALSPLGPMHDVCPLGCCPSGRPSAPTQAQAPLASEG